MHTITLFSRRIKMSGKSENEIHEAFMKGYFKGKKEVIDELSMLMDDQDEEVKKQKEAHE